MYKILSICIIMLCIFSKKSIAQVQQYYKIQGQLIDTVDGVYLEHTSIVALNKSDSVIVSHTRADSDGKFSFPKLNNGNYILVVSHPDFATLYEQVQLSQDTILQNIQMITKRDLLQEVVITNRRAIMVKGDTLEFAADSFKVGEFDNVDELLKRLPGIEVGMDGNIKAHGKAVQKMYVDGEEFFSEDPSVVAKTLRASSIDKVQVYDDQSEAAKETGIDDGEKVKTINLKLKDHAKSGIIAKLGGGYGTKETYKGDGLLNIYNNKRKVGAILLAGNINDISMDFMSGSEYGFNDLEEGVEGGYYGSRNEIDPKEGIPQVLKSGMYYNEKFFDKKLNTTFNYGLQHVNNQANSTATTQYILPDTQYVDYNNTRASSQQIKHSAKFRNIYEIDSTQSIKVVVTAISGNDIFESKTMSNAKNLNGALINESDVYNNTEKSSNNYNASITYKKKFQKQGRSFNINLTGNTSNTDGETQFLSNNALYAMNETIIYNQKKYNTNKTNRFTIAANYSEPIILKKLHLKSNYTFAKNNTTSNNITNDVDTAMNETYNSTFSNHYTFNTSRHTGGVGFYYYQKKISANIGVNATHTQFEQINYTHSLLNRNYHQTNYFPSANLFFKPNTSSSVSLNYSGRTSQPSIQQLQPMVINTDPTNIMIGNPNLNQEFNHDFRLNYNMYHEMSGFYMSMWGGASVRENAIIAAQNINESGIRTYQYVNGKSAVSSNMTINSSIEIVKNLRAYTNLDMGTNKNYTINNNIENLNNTINLKPGMGLNYTKDTTLYLSLDYSPTYYHTKTSLRPELPIQFWNHNTRIAFKYLLPLGITFNTSVQYVFRPNIDPLVSGRSVATWNMNISKRFFKNKALEIALTGYDLLNQNVGYEYNPTGDMIYEKSYNRVQQYFMGSIILHFSKIGKKNTSEVEEIDLN